MNAQYENWSRATRSSGVLLHALGCGINAVLLIASSVWMPVYVTWLLLFSVAAHFVVYGVFVAICGRYTMLAAACEVLPDFRRNFLNTRRLLIQSFVSPVATLAIFHAVVGLSLTAGIILSGVLLINVLAAHYTAVRVSRALDERRLQKQYIRPWRNSGDECWFLGV